MGGASNSGCAVLRQEKFSNEELVQLSSNIDPMTDCDLDYYPLCKIGERFPINDAKKHPKLTPIPLKNGEMIDSKDVAKDDHRVDRSLYLHGILQGISYIEKQGKVVA